MNSPDRDPSEDAWDSVLTPLSRAVQQAEAGVLQVSDPLDAYRTASVAAASLRDAADKMAVIRATLAYRLAEAEGLTIDRLGKRLGVSKTRAQQLADVGRRFSRAFPQPTPPAEPRADEAEPPDAR